MIWQSAEKTADEIASEANIHLRFEPLGSQFNPVVKHQVHLTISFEPPEEEEQTETDENLFLDKEEPEDFGIDPEVD